MISFKYIGNHPDLQGETALGKFDDGHFTVQCDGHHMLGTSVPYLSVDNVDWAHGWHRTPREDWEFSEQPKFVGSRDQAADFIRANRFNLECHVFLDKEQYVVFGSPV